MTVQDADFPEALTSLDREQQERAIHLLRTQLLKGVQAGLQGRAGADSAFVEDVVQTALLRILDRLHTFEGRSRFFTWAMSIALRVAFSELRRKHWGNVSLDVLKESGNEPAAFDGEEALRPDHLTQRRQASQLLHRLINEKLTEKRREVLVAELKGMPQDEVAVQLGMNRNAVYKTAHDARKVLKRSLMEAGFDLDELHATFSSNPTP